MSHLDNPAFPRSAAYDADWVMDGNMGPNPMWLAEWLIGGMDIQPGARVLELGCGLVTSSVFVARETGAHVYAADLWTDPSKNWARVQAAGAAGQVTPIKAEAHALPFADGFFDAIISIDAYQYFGLDPLFLFSLSRLLRPGGQLGVVVPGLMQPFPGGEVPPHLAEPQSNGHAFWEDECISFRTAAEWAAIWGQCPRVEAVEADALEHGWRHWRDWEHALDAAGKQMFPSCAEALEADAGRYIGFVRVRARRNETAGENLYDPELMAKFGG